MSEVTQAPVLPTDTPPVEAPKQESVSPKFEMLAKRESQLVRQQQEIKKQREELEARAKTLESQADEYAKWNERKKLAKLNPTIALEDYGLTYEQLTDYQLRGGTPPGEVIAKSVSEQLAEFKRQQNEELKKLKEESELKSKEQVDQQISDFKESMTEFITGKGEEFELINLYQTYEMVYETIAKHYEDTKRVLSVKEAADLVEKYLEGEAEKALKTKKLSGRLKPSETPQEAQAAKESVSKTLTTSMNSSSVPTTLSAVTEAERIKRALLALG